MSEMNVIVKDKNSNEKLFECLIQDISKAYDYASQMEELGIDIEIIAPSITDTLCNSLGIKNDAKEDYDQSVVAEIDDHDGSCCAKNDTDK